MSIDIEKTIDVLYKLEEQANRTVESLKRVIALSAQTSMIENKRNDELAPILRVQDIANYLGVESHKVYRMAKDPGLPVLRHGNTILIPRDAFLDWINKSALARGDID